MYASRIYNVYIYMIMKEPNADVKKVLFGDLTAWQRGFNLNIPIKKFCAWHMQLLYLLMSGIPSACLDQMIKTSLSHSLDVIMLPELPSTHLKTEPM